MKKFLFFLAVLFIDFSVTANGQTFNGTGGAIPDNGATPTCFPITVSGVGNINNTFGLASVCLDISHTWDSDLEIYLHSPNGTIIALSVQNGGSGDNFTGTCFTGTAIISVGAGNAPFTGNFIPDEPLGTINNGQNADGVWTLCIQDIFSAFDGTLNSWSLTFNNTPALPPPAAPPCLSGTQQAGDDCNMATPVCNFNGYCGNTSSAYGIDTWNSLTNTFCGSIDNNSFITFVASSTTAAFNVWVNNSSLGFGIQMMFYDGGCGSGAVNSYGCYNQINPSAYPTVVAATGLTPGNTYYLMFDGYAGDVCDYTIAPISGVNILAVSPTNPTICSGESVSLTASGGGGTYTWAGPSLNTTSGPTVMANPLVTSSYAVTSADPNGICPITINVVVTVTNTPNPPVVTSPVNLCQNSSASPLNATGINLLWYSSATGGTGSTLAPTPNTSIVGSTNYYVSQTLSCGESVRVPISVNITAGTPAPVVSGPLTYCQNAIATTLTATGNSLLWYNNSTGGTGNSIAPTPSTTIAGTTTYYVSQSSSCGESPRASIAVTINPTPSLPVSSTISYCQNGTTNPLVATGQNLLWYTSSSGGVGSNIAPTPSSAVIGNTNYYVSQTINGCEGPRASVVVTITASTPPPGVTSLINYCEDATASPLTAVGTSLLWYTAASGGVGSTIAPIPSTNIPGATNYYVSQTTNCGEGPRATITVNINPIPAPPSITSNVSYCINETAVPLTANGFNLLWYNTSIGGTGVPSLIPSTNIVGSISYYVTQSIMGCESPRASIDVNVTGLPPAPTVGTTSYTYCQLSAATQLSATGTALLWYTSLPGTGTGIAPIPSTNISGVFNYYVTQTLSCGESQPSTIVVNVNPTPLAPQVNSLVTYCQGATPNILSANGTNLLWYTSSSGGLGNNNAPTPSTVSVGNTPFYVSSTTGSCEGPRAEIIVTVNITPNAPSVSSPVIYCKGNSANPLTANGTLLSWYNTPNGGVASSASPTPSTLNTGTTIYYVSQTTGVCEGPRTSINVEVLNTPNIGSDKKDTICFGGTYNLIPVFNTNGLSVLWTYNGINVTNAYAVDVAGNYQIEVTNNNGCKDTANFMLNIRPPVIANAGHDTIAVKNQPHQLFGNGGDRYVWSPAALLNQSTAQNPLATLNNDQLFVLTVFNTIGCSDKDSVFIKVYKGPNEYVPNAFTPDGDGLNDIFRPIPVGIKKTAWFRVYNRTGQLLFESNRWLDGWDGKYQNKKQPTGNYVWVLKYSIDGVNYQVMKGAVLLLR